MKSWTCNTLKVSKDQSPNVFVRQVRAIAFFPFLNYLSTAKKMENDRRKNKEGRGVGLFQLPGCLEIFWPGLWTCHSCPAGLNVRVLLSVIGLWHWISYMLGVKYPFLNSIPLLKGYCLVMARATGALLSIKKKNTVVPHLASGWLLSSASLGKTDWPRICHSPRPRISLDLVPQRERARVICGLQRDQLQFIDLTVPYLILSLRENDYLKLYSINLKN